MMNANELADELESFLKEQEQLPWGTKQVYLDQAATMLRQQQALIENLNGRIERMIENQSHHEGIAHAGGFEQGYEEGRKMGMQQEEKKALYNLVAEQDKKIIDLAFKLAYAERSNEIVLEANQRSRP